MVASAPSSAGVRQGFVGALTNTARKYPEQKSEGNQTAARKVSLPCVRAFRQSSLTFQAGVDPLLANQMGVSKKYNAASVRGSVTVWIEKGKKSKKRSKMENRTVKLTALNARRQGCTL